MAKYVFRDAECSVCKQVKRACIRLDEEEPILCRDCQPVVQIEGVPNFRMGWKPTVSKISGFGKSFEDFDKDYDTMMREGA